jgi:hypothetical protein
MNRKFLLAFVLIVVISSFAWAGLRAKAGSSERGKYLSGKGIIIPPDEVHIDSYIAKQDYIYRNPGKPLGIYTYTGHNQVSANGQEEIIHIGIKGIGIPYDDLPPMNLSVVLDIGKSMMTEDKYFWSIKAVNMLMDRVRNIDYVSLVIFANNAVVLNQSTQIDSIEKRNIFKDSVDYIGRGVDSNMLEGLKLGYQQVESNYNSAYINRVLLLSDGVGYSDGVFDLVEYYENKNINVTTVGFGKEFDLELMTDIASSGGGSTRFIYDEKSLDDALGSNLDKTVAPVAKDVRISIDFLLDVEITGTWGYSGDIEDNKVTFYQAAIFNRDSETILTQVSIPPQSEYGFRDFAYINVEYTDLIGNNYIEGPVPVRLDFVDMDFPVNGYSNGKVLKSGTMLQIAQSLIAIGEIYYKGIETEKTEYRSELQKALDIAVNTKKETVNARLRLDENGFEEELAILDQYIRILGQDLDLSIMEINDLLNDNEIISKVEYRPVNTHLANLFNELRYNIGEMKGAVVFSDFVSKGSKSSELILLLNELALYEIVSSGTMTIVDRGSLDAVLSEQEISLSDLTNSKNAIKVGNFLSANYILTGTVIEMSVSLIVFAKIINVETSEIESVAQVIIPIDDLIIG